LYTFPYPQTRVTIEMCKACRGLWLDAGEFKQIRQAREQLPSLEEPAQEADAGGVKGTLIRFIDAAIDQLLY
jgi:Zn-finger nucleic acid-binding protein